MLENLSVSNVEYHRGVDNNLYYSVSLLLNGERIAFYNSETMDLIINEEVKENINEILEINFRKYNISAETEKEKVHNLIEKLRELNK